MSKIKLFFKEQIVFDFDKELVLEESQVAFLDKMDSDMDKGVKINGQLFTEPDSKQRAEFVVMNLFKALQHDNQSVITASCAYLSSRLPDVDEVRVSEQEKGIKVEFI